VTPRRGLAILAGAAFLLAVGVAVATWHVASSNAAQERAKAALRTAPRSLDGVRRRDQAHQDERTYDSGYEACGAFGQTTLARRLGLRPAAGAEEISRAFAGRYPIDVRRAFRSGCLDALAGRPED
jgi:hypothetical protein